MRILIVSDAWHPQVNGVVRTLSMVAAELSGMGHVVEVLGPDQFPTMDMPTYGSIKLALFPGRRLAAMIEAFRPDALHVATEGPLGWAARRWACGEACHSPRRSIRSSRSTCMRVRGCRWGWATP